VVQAGEPRPRLRPLSELGLAQRAVVRSDVVQEGEEGSPPFVLPGGTTAHRATLGSGTAARAIGACSAAITKERPSTIFGARSVRLLKFHRRPPRTSRRSPGGNSSTDGRVAKKGVLQVPEPPRLLIADVIVIGPLQVASGEPLDPARVARSPLVCGR